MSFLNRHWKKMALAAAALVLCAYVGLGLLIGNGVRGAVAFARAEEPAGHEPSERAVDPAGRDRREPAAAGHRPEPVREGELDRPASDPMWTERDHEMIRRLDDRGVELDRTGRHAITGLPDDILVDGQGGLLGILL